MSPALFAVVIAAAVLLAGATLILVAVLGARAGDSRKLERRVRNEPVIADEFADASEPTAIKVLARGGQGLEKLADESGETAKLLLQAGWRGAGARLTFYAFRMGMLVFGALLVLALWAFSEGIKPLLLPLYSFALLAFGYLIPMFIHLLVLLFEAGLSTRQAFASLVREGQGVLPELGQEFEGVLRQLEAGGDIADVLKGMGTALDVPDLEGVLGVLRQVDKYGGEIREPLLEALSVLEERRGLDLREKVNLISGRMTVVMVLFFFPALLIFVAGPAVVSILRAMADVAGK